MKTKAQHGLISLGLLLLILLAFYLRIPSIITVGYNMDEAEHVVIAHSATLAQVVRYSLFELHPPLFYLALHFWMKLSDDPFFVRGFPLLLGLLLIPIYYCIGYRIGGKWGGLCCSTLITLSHGCIFQSFAIRHYGLMLVMLSLGLYCYLGWRTYHKNAFLLGYLIFGWLASMSEFSSLLCYFCIAGFESLALLYQRMPSRLLTKWLATNLAVAAFAVFIYHFWEPALRAHKPYFTYFSQYFASTSGIFVSILSAPFAEAHYIFPKFPALIFMAAYAVWRRASGAKNISFYPFASLTAFACIVSMGIYAGGLYRITGGRQSLWMLPLLVPALGAMIADFCIYLAKYYPMGLSLAAFSLLLTLLSDIQEKSLDRGELEAWSMPDQKIVEAFFKTLGPRDIIDMPKFSISLFTDPYPYMDYTVSDTMKMATTEPYLNTRILFNPYYAIEYSTDIMIATLQDALAQHMLDTVDRVIFYEQIWRDPVVDLSLCVALQKKVISIPPFPPNYPGPLTRADVAHRIILLVIPKDVVVNEIVSPTGKARACLNRSHDMIPGLRHP